MVIGVKPKRKHHARPCLNCGKMHIPSQVRRTAYKDKHEHSNMFCSRKCSGMYKNWMSGRKARCKRCHMATGLMVPLSRGGEHVMSNLQVVHQVVNTMKGCMTVNEFVQWCRLVADHCGE